jgi:hypothetical protein
MPTTAPGNLKFCSVPGLVAVNLVSSPETLTQPASMLRTCNFKLQHSAQVCPILRVCAYFFHTLP